MCEYNNEKRASRTHSKRHKALLTESIRIFARKGMVVSEDGNGFCKRHAMLADIGSGFLRIPVEMHEEKVYGQMSSMSICPLGKESFR